MKSELLCGDALTHLRTLSSSSVESVIIDPPAGINFMQKKFDSPRGGRTAWITWLAEIMQEAMRVCKPGGYCFCWSLPRTSHWTACALEDAGWELRDKLYFIFGTGFPKNHDVSKDIDRMTHSEREVTGTGDATRGVYNAASHPEFSGGDYHITAPSSDAAKKYSGYGTALKPSVEEWILCRKPLSEETIAENMLLWGTGALNIDASRIPTKERTERPVGSSVNAYQWSKKTNPLHGQLTGGSPQGRWPATTVLAHSPSCTAAHCVGDCPVLLIDLQSGTSTSSAAGFHGRDERTPTYGGNALNASASTLTGGMEYGDKGGASRYFHILPLDSDEEFVSIYYGKKASPQERNAGCEILPLQETQTTGWSGESMPLRQDGTQRKMPLSRNNHPTVKSLALMAHLITLATPSGGTVLDCFMGSGSTGVAALYSGYDFIGIEEDAAYCAIAEARIAHALQTVRNA